MSDDGIEPDGTDLDGGTTPDLTSDQQQFLAADAALREVIDQLTPDMLKLPVPPEWSSNKTPDLLGILKQHAKDEAWVPDVIAGKTIAEVGDTWNGDLLGSDPIGNYNKLNDLATVAASQPVAEGQIAHLSYGDFPVGIFFEHTSYYRGFQAPLIAKLAGIPFTMSDNLIDLLWSSVEPQIDDLRKIHVFGPPVEAPDDADRETLLLCMTGFWRP
jgi:hypothetical protein